MARIVRFREYGDASVLKIESLDVPPPGADEVQIDVKSIGLNRAEIMFRTHAYLQEAQFPSRLGFEAAGIVKAVGTSVTSFKKGDVVSLVPPTDIARWGTYGEVANVPARNLVKHPPNISFEEAAASWMQYVTAWGALIAQAKLTAGDFVIVIAASSSVGIAAFQIAKAVGATVIATTRTQAKKQALMDHGADHVVVTAEEHLVARVREITRSVGATRCVRSSRWSVLHPPHRQHGAGRHFARIWRAQHGADAVSSVHSTGQELDLEGLSEWRDHERRHCPRTCKGIHYQRARFWATEARHRTQVPS